MHSGIDQTAGGVEGGPTTQALIAFLEKQDRIARGEESNHWMKPGDEGNFRAAADALRSLSTPQEAMICEFCGSEEGDIPSYLEVCPSCWTKANEGSGWMQHYFDLRAEVARLTDERDTLQALWTEVGQHINAAAIGYNHPQILGVFTMNRAFKEERRQLLDSAELAEREVARLTQARAPMTDAERTQMRLNAHYDPLRPLLRARVDRLRAIAEQMHMYLSSPAQCTEDAWDSFERNLQDLLVDGPQSCTEGMKAERAPWQPIETAPKNGTRVLIAFPEYGVGPRLNIAAAEYVEYAQAWRDSPDDEDAYFPPTHWLPLPAGPLPSPQEG